MTRHERLTRAKRAIAVLGVPEWRAAIAATQHRDRVDEAAYVIRQLGCSPERAAVYLAQACAPGRGSDGHTRTTDLGQR